MVSGCGSVPDEASEVVIALRVYPGGWLRWAAQGSGFRSTRAAAGCVSLPPHRRAFRLSLLLVGGDLLRSLSLAEP
jgi:hypothetical protein